MSLCPFIDAGPADPAERGTLWRCPTCEAEVRAKSLPKRTCRFLGPGGYLLRIMRELDVPPAGCGCRSLAVKMDRWGVDGCRQNRAELVAAMVEPSVLLAQRGQDVRPEWMVDEAIRRAASRPTRQAGQAPATDAVPRQTDTATSKASAGPAAGENRSAAGQSDAAR
jgi:hypothetical protein